MEGAGPFSAVDIGAYTAPGNRYGSLNQDYVEVWRADAPACKSAACGCGCRSGGGGLVRASNGGGGAPAPPPLVIGAVLDGHGLLGEAAARNGGAAVVRELRRLVGGHPLQGQDGKQGKQSPQQQQQQQQQQPQQQSHQGHAPANGNGACKGAAPPASNGAANGNGTCCCRATGEGAAGVEAEVVAAATTPAPRPLAAVPEAEVRALVEAAFAAAHASALSIYDDPPRTACYPDSRTGAAAVYCLHTRSGSGGGGGGAFHVYASAAAGRGGGPACRPLECGATCTVAVLQGRRLVVGNVGDSSAVLGSLEDDGSVSARLLTRQHCGLHPEEAARITQGYAGSVRILPHDGYMSVSAPSSMWAGYELAVTRALGHKAMEAFGVLHLPSVACVDLRPEDCCVVLASDGVWDVMDPREVVNRVADALGEGLGAEAAARRLVEDAVALAEGAPSGDADNTSAVVIALPLAG